MLSIVKEVNQNEIHSHKDHFCQAYIYQSSLRNSLGQMTTQIVSKFFTRITQNLDIPSQAGTINDK